MGPLAVSSTPSPQCTEEDLGARGDGSVSKVLRDLRACKDKIGVVIFPPPREAQTGGPPGFLANWAKEMTLSLNARWMAPEK